VLHGSGRGDNLNRLVHHQRGRYFMANASRFVRAPRSYTRSVDLDGATLLSALQEPDELTLRFSPYGLGGRLTPSDAARFQAASIARAVLVHEVPEDARNNFERARKLHL